MTIDDVQELIELTPKQKKSWIKLTRAWKECLINNILFYQNLDTLGAFNGENVASIIDYGDGYPENDDPFAVQNLTWPSMQTTDAWADDQHKVVLRSKGNEY